MRLTLRIVGRTFVAALVALAIALVVFTVAAPRVTGGAVLAVLSGSMHPTYPVGSAVLVVPTPTEDLGPGDVITFQTAPGVADFVTHRIVAVDRESDAVRFTTKGDANRVDDAETVPAGAVHGRVVVHVPHLGRLNLLIGSDRGPYLVIMAASLTIIGTQVRRLVTALRDEEPEEATSDGPPPPHLTATRDLVTADTTIDTSSRGS